VSARPLDALHAATRLVVVDVESSGLDPGSDALLAIGAVTVEAGHIPLAEPFYAVLRQSSASSDANILVHGIARDEQVAGADAAEALAAFTRFVDGAPLLAWHSAFDELFISRAARHHARTRFEAVWIDVAALAHAVFPSRKSDALDDWCAEFGIANARRHHALADALATAQLLLALQPLALQQGLRTVLDLSKAAKAQAWLRRSASRHGA
jgi:DNA polymerase III subunit epsilon